MKLAACSLLLLLLPLLAIACADEIDSVDPYASTAPSSPQPPSAADGGVLVIPSYVLDAGWLPSLPDGGGSSLDGAIAIPTVPIGPVAPFGCVAGVPTELEPNDAKPQPLVLPFVCGTIGGATDALDLFEAESGPTKKVIRLQATSDATLTVSAFGFSKTVANGGSIEVPSFGTSLKFQMRVSSPTGAATQSYRIDVTAP